MMTVRDAWERAVAQRADHVFLVWEDPDTAAVREYTYAQMNERVIAAASLLASHGVGLGDRVGVQLGNDIEFVDYFLALAHIGGVLVPLSPDFTWVETSTILRAAGARLLVCRATVADSAQEWDGVVVAVGELADDDARTGAGGAAAAVDEAAIGVAVHSGDSTPGETVPRPELSGETLLEIMFTSGTTGEPKGVMLTHANAVFSGEYVNWELAMTAEDRYLSSMVATHVNLQFSALMPVITAGATLILERRYSASRFWEQVRRHEATLVQGMAMIARTMMAQPVAEGERDHKVRVMHYFLSLTDEEKEAFTERFGITLLNNYGSTECLIGAITDPPTGETRWPSIGLVGPGYRVEIRSREGEALPPGERGEICLHGQAGLSLMAGYYQRPDLTDEVLVDGWYHTGDCGYMDEDGWVYFIDRFTDVIKRSGVNISAFEVESAIAHHPGVAEVAVVGIPDPVRDQAVKACVVARPGYELSEEDVLAVAREYLTCIKIPTVVEFLDELPRGEYGKVRKSLLAGTDQTSCCPTHSTHEPNDGGGNNE